MTASRRSYWFVQGFWNVFEHGLARGMDAVATLAILWCVPTAVFSQLALAQAYVAPALFFFIAPETALYRNFSKWTEAGAGGMLTRMRIFRRFAWAKGLLALLLAAVIAASFPAPSGTDFGFVDRFFALVWAFTLPLLPQIAGPDREFLRLSLDLKTLNALTFYQRAIYLALLVPAARYFPNSFPLIAGCGIATTFVTIWIARLRVETKFAGVVPVAVEEGSAFGVLKGALRGYSLWNHFSGIVIGWLQTLDLFFLGWFRLPAVVLGLYSVVLKLAGLSLAIPNAVANLYQVYLGRTEAGAPGEVKRLFRLTAGLTSFSILQAALFFALAPWILATFSRGRWDIGDQARMLLWLKSILVAGVIFASCLLFNGWLSIRTSFRALIFRVYLPWAVGGFILYGVTGRTGDVDAMARMNVPVMALLIPLFAILTVSLKKSRRAEPSSL